MRCCACNKVLSDYELVLKLPSSGEFADLCGKCYSATFSEGDDYDEYRADDLQDVMNMLNAFEAHRHE